MRTVADTYKSRVRLTTWVGLQCEVVFTGWTTITARLDKLPALKVCGITKKRTRLHGLLPALRLRSSEILLGKTAYGEFILARIAHERNLNALLIEGIWELEEAREAYAAHEISGMELDRIRDKYHRADVYWQANDVAKSGYHGDQRAGEEVQDMLRNGATAKEAELALHNLQAEYGQYRDMDGW